MSFSRRSLLVGLSSLLASCTTAGKLKLPEAVPAPIPVPEPRLRWLPLDGRAVWKADYPILYQTLKDCGYGETADQFNIPKASLIPDSYRVECRIATDYANVANKIHKHPVGYIALFIDWIAEN